MANLTDTAKDDGPDEKGCWKAAGPFNQCCCDCVYHLEDTFHCQVEDYDYWRGYAEITVNG